MNSLLFVPAVVCLMAAFWANNAKAAAERFDVNGTTGGSGVVSGGSYTWEAAGFSSAAAGTDPVPWVEGNFVRFAAGTDAGANNYTVTANSDHTFAGMFLQANGGGTVTVNGPGVLSIASGDQGFLVNGSAQSLVINAVLGGSGRLVNQLSGSLFLYGNNTFSGGVLLSTVAGLNFNNANSFGTGTITWGVAQQVLADPAAAAPITLANNMVTRAASQLILVTPAVAPVTISGTTTLAAGTSTFTMNNAATKLTLSGNIAGSGGNIVKNGPGTLVISGTGNTYNGTTTISAGKLQLGVANTIASSSSLILSGGTIDPNGFNQAMASTTLSLTAGSTIDFTAGACELDFANSSALAWTGILDFLNFDPSVDKVRFGSDQTGLTSAQVAKITINGAGLGVAQLDPSGYVLVPEPSTALLGLLGGLSVMRVIRRRKA